MNALWNAQFGFAPALAQALLHSLWQDALLAIVAALLLAAMAKRSAGSRHTLGMLILIAMVLLPAATFLGFWRESAVDVNAGWVPAISAPAAGAIPGTYVQQSVPLAGVLASLWLLGVLVMLLRQFGGWRLVGALENQPFAALPPYWQQRVAALQHTLKISRTVVVRLAADVAAPFTARLLRPIIWLPASLLTRLPAQQIEALLAHELAHIARLDWLWNGLQCAIESLLFFHPGAWWLSRRIRQEREHACDDLAVAACGNALDLVEALTELERHRHPFPRLVLSAQGGSLMNRVTRLLTGSTSRFRWQAPVALAVLFGAGTLLATQIKIGPHAMPTIRIVSSTEGTLGPGDIREITADGLDGKRYYRASVDPQGHLTELYKFNGKVATIDGTARAWIEEVARLSVPPAPPAPPAPPSLANMQPPTPPTPPAPPKFSDSTAFKAILRLVAADPAVTARLGNPIVMTTEPVDGRLSESANGGDADLSFVLGGPSGHLQVHVEAHSNGGVWRVDHIDLPDAH
jgi:beta-lactamase regulating signal transducer with metallopeptidase domain